MNKAEFERIAKDAAANVKAIRQAEEARLVEIQRERLLRRAELERQAKDQGVALPKDAELDALKERMNKIGQWPDDPAPLSVPAE